MADRTFKNLIEYGVFRIVAGFLQALPRNWTLAIGAVLGNLSRYLLGKRRRTAQANLMAAFPEMTPAELDRTVRGIFRHMGLIGSEMLILDRLGKRDRLEDLLTVLGREHLQAAMDEGRGALILTAHVGFWEIGPVLFPYLGVPTDFISKPMKNTYVNNYFRVQREAGGTRLLPAKHGARRIIKSLAEGRAVGVLLDQHIAPHVAVRVPFFGRPAWTSPIVAQMAMKLQVPVVPAFCWRTSDNRYEVEFQTPIHFANDPDPAAIVANTALLTQKIEEAVRRDLTQWFWVHRRWRD